MEGYEKLELNDAPNPTPAAGEAVLRVKFVALNPADAWLAKAQYPAKPSLPHVLGRDAIGEVIAIGPGVSDVKVGETKVMLRSDVGVTRWGALAEKVAVPIESLVNPPAGWSAEQSASGPLVYLTAFQALTLWDDLPEKAIVLVTGAAGGVGVATVQLAKAMGHVVIGSSRSADKRKTLREIGCDQTIDPTVADWPTKLAESMNGVGVDLAVDVVGGEGFNKVIACLAEKGRISTLGQSAGPVPNFKPGSIFFKLNKIGGVSVANYSATESHEAWQQIVRLLGRTNAKPIVDCVFSFEQAKEAFARLEDSPVGKVVVRVAE